MRHKRRLFVPLVVYLCLAYPCFAQEAAGIWKRLAEPAFDSTKMADVDALTLTLDRITVTLAHGQLQLVEPANGVVFGAAFRGEGRVRIQPPNAMETQQLWLHTALETVDFEFTEAALIFSRDISPQVTGGTTWRSEPGAQFSEMYNDRQHDREDSGAELLPRLFRSVLSTDAPQNTLFLAELKTEKKGWIYVHFDSRDPEEIEVGQWKLWDGGARRPDVWLKFPAAGRRVVDAFRDPLAKEDFLIRSYQIAAEVADGAELSATAKVHIDGIVPGLRVLLFLLDSNLRVDSVTEAGQKLEFFQPRDPKDRVQSYGDYVAVVVPAPTRQREAKTLEFAYHGKRVIRRVGQGQFFCQSFGWYPTTANAFATRADFQLSFKVPKKYGLVATGTKTGESPDGNMLTSTWKSDVPLCVAGFAFGDYRVETKAAGSVTVEVYANKDADDEMRQIQEFSGMSTAPGGARRLGPALGSLSPSVMAKIMLQEVVNSLNLFETYFGPFPFRRLAVTNIPYSYGQGWPSLLYLSALSFLDSTQRNALGMTGHPEITDFFRAHETSHQWWGHLVGWNSYHDQWLSEGFAQFSGNLYVQFRQDSKQYVERLRRDKEALKATDQRGRRYESLGPIWMGTRLASSDAPRGYASVVYNKGGYVLHMLRMMLQDLRNAQAPDGAFIAVMKEFCATYGGKPASTEDFKAVVEKHMTPAMDLDKNRRMNWFFDQYVYGTGIPEYRLQYKVESNGEGRRWKVSGKIMQDKVPGDWKNLVPVYLHAGGKSARALWLRAIGPETPFEIIMPFKPESLSVNDNEDILADIN